MQDTPRYFDPLYLVRLGELAYLKEIALLRAVMLTNSLEVSDEDLIGEADNFYFEVAAQVDALFFAFANDECIDALISLDAHHPDREALFENLLSYEQFQEREAGVLGLKEIFLDCKTFNTCISLQSFKDNTYTLFERYIDALYDERVQDFERERQNAQTLQSLLGEFAQCSPEDRDDLLKKMVSIGFPLGREGKLNAVLEMTGVSEDKVSEIKQFVRLYSGPQDTEYRRPTPPAPAISERGKGVMGPTLGHDLENATNHSAAIRDCFMLMRWYSEIVEAVTGIRGC